ALRSPDLETDQCVDGRVVGLDGGNGQRLRGVDPAADHLVFEEAGQRLHFGQLRHALILPRVRVVVTRAFPGDEVDVLRRDHEVVVWPEARPMTPRELVDACADACAVVSMLTDPIDAAFFDACPDVRVVANVAVGYDNIDVVEATRRGIAVGNTPGVLTEATADLTWALILAASRRVVEAADVV